MRFYVVEICVVMLQGYAFLHMWDMRFYFEKVDLGWVLIVISSGLLR